jgi:hypothetical protein
MAALALLGWLAGCARYHPAAPEGFGSYPRGSVFKSPLRAVSPDGVLFTVRTEANKPKADLPFWREALKTRMIQAGYRVIADTTCSMRASTAALLKLAAPVGDQDYVYWIAFTLSGSGGDILVAEAAGESKRFLARKDPILKAIETTGF